MHLRRGFPLFRPVVVSTPWPGGVEGEERAHDRAEDAAVPRRSQQPSVPRRFVHGLLADLGGACCRRLVAGH
jgi:hypothetical protein